MLQTVLNRLSPINQLIGLCFSGTGVKNFKKQGEKREHAFSSAVSPLTMFSTLSKKNLTILTSLKLSYANAFYLNNAANVLSCEGWNAKQKFFDIK